MNNNQDQNKDIEQNSLDENSTVEALVEAEATEGKGISKKTIYKNLIIVAIILILVIIWMVSQQDINKLAKTFTEADYSFIGIGVLAMLASWFLSSMSLHIIVKRKVGKIVNPIDSVLLANSAVFFNGITPFQSGGQPFQIYNYRKFGVRGANATGIIMMNFIIYQLSLITVSTISIIFFYSEISKNVNNFIIFVLIGFIINSSILALLILIAISKHFRKFCDFIMSKVVKLKFLRKKGPYIEAKMHKYVADFQISFKELLHSKWMLIRSFTLQILSLLLYYSTPYFVFLALGIELDFSNLLIIIAMSAFACCFMTYLPTPGAAGGAEFAFTVLFVSLSANITGTISASGAIMWRIITYYLGMLIGLISFSIFEIRYKKRKRRGLIPKREEDPELKMIIDKINKEE